MWSRVSIPRQGKGMWLLHPVPHVESKKRRSIEFYALDNCNGGFPLSRNFYVRTHVHFTWGMGGGKTCKRKSRTSVNFQVYVGFSYCLYFIYVLICIPRV